MKYNILIYQGKTDHQLFELCIILQINFTKKSHSTVIATFAQVILHGEAYRESLIQNYNQQQQNYFKKKIQLISQLISDDSCKI